MSRAPRQVAVLRCAATFFLFASYVEAGAQNDPRAVALLNRIVSASGDVSGLRSEGVRISATVNMEGLPGRTMLWVESWSLPQRRFSYLEQGTSQHRFTSESMGGADESSEAQRRRQAHLRNPGNPAELPGPLHIALPTLAIEHALKNPLCSAQLLSDEAQGATAVVIQRCQGIAGGGQSYELRWQVSLSTAALMSLETRTSARPSEITQLLYRSFSSVDGLAYATKVDIIQSRLGLREEVVISAPQLLNRTQLDNLLSAGGTK